MHVILKPVIKLALWICVIFGIAELAGIDLEGLLSDFDLEGLLGGLGDFDIQGLLGGLGG